MCSCTVATDWRTRFITPYFQRGFQVEKKSDGFDKLKLLYVYVATHFLAGGPNTK